MPLNPMLDVLRQREAYLRQRIVAKRTVGWDVIWDERERAALEWAIGRLSDEPLGISGFSEVGQNPSDSIDPMGVSDTIDQRWLDDDALRPG